MSTNVTLNGVTYAIPAEGDSGWGTVLSNYFIAIASSTLQKTGGTFALTAETNFGATFGVKSAYLKSQAANPSATGIIRLGNNESIGWRNVANGADLTLKVDTSDNLNFNGASLSVGGTPVQTAITVSDTATIDLDLTLDNITASIVAGSITNSMINNSAAIAYSKLSIGAGDIAYSKLALTGAILNADLAGSIAYSKLSLTGAILNADLAGSIASSKLVGTDITTVGTITTGVWSGTAIALNKIAALSTSKALQSNASTGAIEASSVTNTELGYLSGVTSAIQTQLTAKQDGIQYKDEGSNLGTSGTVTSIDFTGSNVSVSRSTNAITVAITGSTALSVVAKTTTYTATTADDVITVGTASAWTLALYAASGNSGKILRVKKTTSDLNALTIDANASELIDGALTTTIVSQYEEIALICDGTGWHILSRDYPKSWTSYTPTGSWTGGNVSYAGKWVRSGDSMLVQGKIALIGAPTGTTLSINLPTNYVIDTAKLVEGTTAQRPLPFASGWIVAGGAGYFGQPAYDSTTSVRLLVMQGATSSNNTDRVTQAVPGTFANGDLVDFSFSVPIVGWN